ncbi:MAG: ATP-binding cassette domain-containing protein, partial [Pseudobacter sp.]
MPPVITVNHLSKYYQDIKAVDDISFTVNKGDVYGFLGQNGAGKSTTI